jgi:hypothetical protein
MHKRKTYVGVSGDNLRYDTVYRLLGLLTLLQPGKEKGKLTQISVKSRKQCSASKSKVGSGSASK